MSKISVIAILGGLVSFSSFAEECKPDDHGSCLSNDAQSLLQSKVGKSTNDLTQNLDIVPAEVKTMQGDPIANNHPEECSSTATEALAVRCCKTGQTSKIMMREYGCTGSCAACRAKSYQEAVSHCASYGFRLCTLDEHQGSAGTCASSSSCSTGCGMNGERFWTSTACTTTTTTTTTTTSSTTSTTTSTTCPSSVEMVPNWQDFAKMDYPITPGCGPAGDHACYGNGACCQNICICDIGWRGPYCSQLDLLPAKKSAYGIPMDGGHTTWGGAAVFDASSNNWKLLSGTKIALPAYANLDPYTYWDRDPDYDKAAAASGSDPFHGKHPWQYTVDSAKDPLHLSKQEVDPSRDLYEPKSWLSMFESSGSDPAGPYTSTVKKWYRAFRADFKKDPKTGALLELSNANGGFTIIQSASGSINGPWTDKDGKPLDAAWAGGTGTPSTTTPLAPPVYKYLDNGHCSKGWKSLGALYGKYITKDSNGYRECTVTEKDAWNCHVADPSFVVHANGTTVITYRGTKCESANGVKDHTERLGLIYADCWHCSYTKALDPMFEDHEVMNGGLEDLFMWTDFRGTHMIVHSQAQDHAHDLSLDRATFHHKKKRGAYLFSADGKERWSLSDWELFPAEIYWDDDTTTFLLKQQRPSLIFDPQTGRPSHLITGVDFLFDSCCDWYAYGSGWTLVQPISGCPAGQIATTGSGCTKCSPSDAAYNSRCTKATSKYGKCVCAECSGGYSGDKCDQAPPPLYQTTCAPLQTKKHCSGGTFHLIGTTPGIISDCLSLCEKKATALNAEGCCFQFSHSSNGRCRFQEGGTLGSNNAGLKAASLCVRQCVDHCPR